MNVGLIASRVPRGLITGSPAPIDPSPYQSDARLIDSVKIPSNKNYREPAEAISLMSQFDNQLGISKDMKWEKRSLMAESSHTFFRASPVLFYHDLHTTYRRSSQLMSTPAPTVAILGDAHALNAGTFRGPDGQTVWGLNDFDQAENGSPEWDLERLGVSLYVASRSGGQSAKDSMKLVELMGRSYLNSLGEEGPSFLTKEETSGEILDLMDKAGAKSQEKLLRKWTTSGGRKLLRNRKLEEPPKKRGRQVKKALQETFPELTILDLASKPHSGGSTRGLERYYALVRSEDRSEPWLLETKAVLPSPVQIQDGDLRRGDGQKVLNFWEQMGGQVDERHRGFQLNGVAFFTREREKEKYSLSDDFTDLKASAVNVGRVLARAHGKSSANIKEWIGYQEDRFLSKLVGFSRTYARQVESDFREWKSRYG